MVQFPGFKVHNSATLHYHIAFSVSLPTLVVLGIFSSEWSVHSFFTLPLSYQNPTVVISTVSRYNATSQLIIMRYKNIFTLRQIATFQTPTKHLSVASTWKLSSVNEISKFQLFIHETDLSDSINEQTQIRHQNTHFEQLL